MSTSERIAGNDLINRVKEVFGHSSGEDGVEIGVLAVFSDAVGWMTITEFLGSDASKLLEIRAYDSNQELHAMRNELDSDFVVRVCGDDDYDWYFDDTQYLDINNKKSSGSRYVTTGGGAFTLPIEDAEKLQVRNYVRYGEADGMARIVDFRIVGLRRQSS